jgi:hypothetical protein
MTQTIQETIRQLHGSLRDYIEATYHISASPLIAQRRELLDRPGVIHQIPYMESTPRYQSGAQFSAIKGLSSAALKAYSALSSPREPVPARRSLFSFRYSERSPTRHKCVRPPFANRLPFERLSSIR